MNPIDLSININPIELLKNNIKPIIFYNNISPLRYPGGKTRACKIIDEIILQHFDFKYFDTIISPFLEVVHLNFIYKINIILN